MKANARSIMLAAVAAAIFSLAAGQAGAATYAVTRLSDGPAAATTRGTLRWAITQAELDAVPDSIIFKTQGTIVLSNSLPWIDTPITITGPGIVISGNNACPIFGVGANSDSTSVGNLTLSRLTLANGVAEVGGAVFIDGGTVSAANCTFKGNLAYAGGAIFGEYASVSLTRCTFSDNNAFAAGGAISVGLFTFSGELSATDCTFTKNSCVALEGAEEAVAGGAIVYFAVPPSGDPTVVPPTLIHCTFNGNRAVSASGDAFGGAVAGLWVSATRCTFRNNEAVSTAPPEEDLSNPGSFIPTGYAEGGAILAVYGALVTDCAFARNQAGDPAADPDLYPSGGGAIATLPYAGPGYVLAINCSFGANSAGDGSAVVAGYLYLGNSIVWGNPAASGMQLVAYYMGEVAYSDVEGCGGSGPGWLYGPNLTDGGGNIDANPRWLLNPQQGDQDNNGGVLQLLEGSPCIDAGNNLYAEDFGLTVDLLGRKRFINDLDTPDTGVGDPPIVDMGAYEFRQ